MDRQGDGAEVKVVKDDGQIVVQTTAQVEVQLQLATAGQQEAGAARVDHSSSADGHHLLLLLLLLFGEPQLHDEEEGYLGGDLLPTVVCIQNEVHPKGGGIVQLHLLVLVDDLEGAADGGV